MAEPLQNRESWINKRYSIRSEKLGEGSARPNDSIVTILHDDQPIGSFQHKYGMSPQIFLPVTIDGSDFAVYAPNYYQLGVMSLPDCKQTFLMPEEWWSDDDCPLAFYADDRFPGLVFVIWVEYANDYFHRASYFWLSPDGTVNARPQGPFDVSRWQRTDPASKFFEFEDIERNSSGEREGWLIIKTETRISFTDLVKERELFA